MIRQLKKLITLYLEGSWWISKSKKLGEYEATCYDDAVEKYSKQNPYIEIDKETYRGDNYYSIEGKQILYEINDKPKTKPTL